VTLLRQIEVEMGQGKSTQIACRDAGISEQSFRDELLNGEIFYSLRVRFETHAALAIRRESSMMEAA
jgi:hypothetical protein